MSTARAYRARLRGGQRGWGGNTLHRSDDIGSAPIGEFEPSVGPKEVVYRVDMRGGGRR